MKTYGVPSTFRVVERPLVRLAAALFLTVSMMLTSAVPHGGGLPTRAGAARVSAQVAASGNLLLNEILFRPVEGQPQFVELKSASADEIVLEDATLTNEAGETYTLPPDLDPLPPGGLLLILFDGENPIDGATVHADEEAFLDPESGFVILRQSYWLLDRIAWGETQPDSVNLSRGGFIPELIPGTTIGRFPLSTAVSRSFFAVSRSDWVTFAPDEATPGEPTPVPRVEVLLPLDGAILDTPSVSLTWYPVAGAASYRVQLASDEMFSAPLIDETGEVPSLTTDSLPPGQYFWRVQTIAADGSAADFSPVHSFTVRPGQMTLGQAAQGSGHTLDVPLIKQRKDTRMLLLESKRESGPHAWDAAHPDLDRLDPADRYNCALAGTAMVNAYYGGSLSQDRIGFELRKDIYPGPEFDLNYGRGLSTGQATQALTFALGAAPTLVRHNQQDLPGMWSFVTRTIDAGTPFLAGVRHHVVVLIGYYQGEDSRFIVVNDPWRGAYAVEFSPRTTGSIRGYWVPAVGGAVASDEPEIHQDSDGDGVVDFDETKRFGTDPNNPDSDQDKVEDKVEIRTSLFDPIHGYALWGGPGRDLDQDGLAMELDEDSDDGGCKDGEEDLNLNGEYEETEGETYNFDHTDDGCWKGRFERRWTRTVTATSPGLTTVETEFADVGGEFTITFTPAWVRELAPEQSHGSFHSNDGHTGPGRVIDATWTSLATYSDGTTIFCDFGHTVTEAFLFEGWVREVPDGLDIQIIYVPDCRNDLHFNPHPSCGSEGGCLESLISPTGGDPLFGLLIFEWPLVPLFTRSLHVSLNDKDRGWVDLQYEGPTPSGLCPDSDSDIHWDCQIETHFTITIERKSPANARSTNLEENPRIVDGEDDGTDRVDIGAYEPQGDN